MAQVINTNTISLNAQRNLGTSGASLATTIQRLSSGLRINSAKDDAAGLAISERFSTQIRGLDVAVRNANDGISLAQVAEGSLTEIGNNLQRIRELSVQSANATNSSSDRAALNAEVKQLTAEIDRVAKQADFNGTKLLDGSFTSQLFQVGANASQAIAIDKVVDAKANALGGAKFDKNALAAADPGTNGDVKVTGLVINGVAIDTVDVKQGADAATTGKAARAALVTAINAKMGESGVYAEVNAAGTGIDLTSVKDSVNADGSFKAITATVGTWTGIAAPTFTATAAAAAPANQYASNLDISTFKGAQQALEIVDKALTAVNSARADLGAVQNRFTSVVANLQTSSENLAASRSRIRDTDFAKETAELTRTQILQQAGTAMLAQANQVPQNVLSLLR
ncbi:MULTISPECIES: flagellin [unclassified Pseudoxanthomonas]|jgi:flagellin|uniref:flagellin n=3 Tax=Pseudoxanthomonas TaxID=83618 RepID=UPI00160CCD82|nr:MULTISPECIES: flagellin [unclassified Pseudoxanthomonas]MBB3274547.1 flagellin [Pseudoxanthomonas sp. OG2]MBD9378222.1 flagellin [Pseudoxanthomonas sp. PXM04]MBV7475053.1 flagellin [Pseudoxanthomonas sp. PXM05]UBB27139.1 flagellin [Pseudoxanthomonas japonensis]